MWRRETERTPRFDTVITRKENWERHKLTTNILNDMDTVADGCGKVDERTDNEEQGNKEEEAFDETVQAEVLGSFYGRSD